MKNIAILDLDDTLGDFRGMACAAFNAKYNKQSVVSDWKHHSLTDVYGIDLDTFIMDLIEMGIIENMQPHASAKQFVTELKEMGYYIVILTAREWHPDAFAITEAWLTKWGIVFDELLLCGINDKKVDVVENHFASVKLVVDDSPFQLEHYLVSPNVESVYIYDMPWNEDHTFEVMGGLRVSNLLEISEDQNNV